MDEKPVNRRRDAKPAEQGAGRQRDPMKPKSRPKTSDAPERGHGRPEKQPEGFPIDKSTPKPGTRFGGKDILDGERSDRESGRPIQLEDDDPERMQEGRADSEPGLSGRQQEGRGRQRTPGGQKTNR
jgi:hypothetical protein